MTLVEDYIYQYEGEQQKIMLFFHEFLTHKLGLTEKIRFNIPFYYGKSWICYLNPIKETAIEFAFVRGNELSNKQRILDNKGRKQVYSTTLKKLSDAPIDFLTEVIQEAILLDETTPYESKNKSKK